MKNTKLTIISSLIFLAFLLSFMGCSQESPVSAINTPNNLPTAKFDKKGKQKAQFPRSASCKLTYNSSFKGYNGGGAWLSDGSGFIIFPDALTPPPGTPKRKDVTIDVTVDMNDATGELIFDFGPSGCRFDPKMELVFSWKDLGSGTPTLYYIDDNGNYIEQQPENIDFINQLMFIHVPHFSRYAVAISR